MKILYIGQFRLPNYDAAAARVLNIARSLRLAGHVVSFISWGGELREEDKGADGTYRVDGFPYIVTNELDISGNKITKALGWVRRGNKTKALMREWLGQFDTVITYGGVLSCWLLWFCGRNKIHLVADLTEWNSYKEMSLLQRPWYFINMHLLLPRVKNKILISSFLNRSFEESHNIVVPATCDASEKKWYEGREKALIKARPYDGITLIYAGIPARKDALHYVIAAVNQVAKEGGRIRFLILGCEKEEYLSKNQDLFSRGYLDCGIQFLGKVSQNEVPAFYSLADFMVLLREQTRKSNAGFPTKFSESFISGTPVIANLTSDIGDYLIDGETGFVVDEPSEAAVYRVIHDKVLNLNREDISRMKQYVTTVAKRLEYHAYVDPLNAFISHLN